MYGAVTCGKRKKTIPLFLARIFVPVLLAAGTYSCCSAQLALSGYFFANVGDPGPKWGGTMGMGWKSGFEEYWCNMEFTYHTETQTYPAPVPLFPSESAEFKYTTFALLGVYHKGFLWGADENLTMIPFAELCGGLEFAFLRAEGAYVTVDDDEKTKGGLMIAGAVGMDIAKKVRLRIAPYAVIGSASRSGVQMTAFWLFSYPEYKVVNE